MGWNFRIILNDGYFAMHEAYYALPGDKVPEGWTEDAVTIGAEDVNGVAWSLAAAALSLEKPVLNEEGGPATGQDLISCLPEEAQEAARAFVASARTLADLLIQQADEDDEEGDNDDDD